MRSFGKPVLAAALVLKVCAPAVAQTSGSEALYREVVVRETVLRHDIDGRRPGAPAMPLLRRARILIGTYEDIARLFPASGQGDKALWKGAMLAADAFWEFGEAADKDTALRLFNTLATRYPASRLNAQIPSQTSRLNRAPVPSATQSAGVRTAPAAESSPPPSRASSLMPPAALPATAIAVSPRPTAPSGASAPSPLALLKSIRREVLPGALRVTMEMEREVSFHDERLDSPSRVFIDLENTRTVDTLKEAALAFPDDVVRQIRVGRQQGSRTRVVLDLTGAGRYSTYALYNPYRIVIDFERVASEVAKLTETSSTTEATRTASTTRTAAKAAPITRGTTLTKAAPTIRDTKATRGQDLALVSNPGPPIIAPPPKVAPASVSATATIAAPAGGGPTASARDSGTAPATARAIAPADAAVLPNVSPTPTIDTAIAPGPPNANSRGGFSLSRQLGLGVARIVIDPGHGGHDPGAQVTGLSEADLVLDVALRLEKLLLKQSGVEVVMVRRANVFIPLEERTAIANREGADLFLSIHANASGDTRVRGVETYFLNFAPNPQAEAIAARENAGSARTMRSLPDIVKAIALNNKIDESRDFATLVQASMVERLKKVNRDARNLGVKQAPFMVLIGATMPSILAEISFVTHRQESALLKTEGYRQQIAEALLNGVMRYQKSLKASQIATK